MFLQKVKAQLQWVLGLPLRVISFTWPLVTELLALLWWGKTGLSWTLVATFLLIAGYVFLIFCSNRLVYSMWGFIAAFALISVPVVLVVVHLFSGEEVPSMLWVHMDFGVAWCLTIWLISAVER